MSLGMLLSRTDSTRLKKRGSGSKTRSITEKQLSFQAVHSHSAVYLKDSTPMSNLTDIGTSSAVVQEERAGEVTEEDQEDGWFTANESKRLSQKLSF
mmetsp:Transcript_21465/g.28783  ORF Transcript_21465/g.28783 Transcript_21465/m.28783 type:complete len:97 (-) Transcript_21465:491-781(-)